MLQRKHMESKIYPYATLNDLRKDLITKCRNIAGLRREDHPWASMDDLNLSAAYSPVACLTLT